ncbi:MAG: class I SAM-dependent methyltransferase [Patescibacteria group bacterium]
MSPLPNSNLKSIWDKVSLGYSDEAIKGPDYVANFQTVHQVMGKVKGKKILDVGCGTGSTDAYLASLGAQTTLVDVSDVALSFARKIFRKLGLKAKFVQADAFNLPFKKESFDIVWNGGVLEHFCDEKKVEMLSRMWSLVKPGGRLVVLVPNSLDLPFMLAKQVLIWRRKWAFGFEDDMPTWKLSSLLRAAKILTSKSARKIKIYAYNPIVGWWFFPYGRETTTWFGLNTVRWHKMKSPLGHIIVMVVEKS